MTENRGEPVRPIRLSAPAPEPTATVDPPQATPAAHPPEPPQPRAAPARHRGRRALRATSWVVLVLSVLTLATSGVLYRLYNHYDANITRLPSDVFVRPPQAKPRPVEVDGAGDTFLLVGSDSREGLTKEQLAEARTQYDGTDGTDTMLLVTLSKKRDAASVVSFPRDSWVDIPGHGKDRINAAYAIGGPALLLQTVEDLTGVRVEHYVQVGFVGFLNMTKAVGGVEVCLKADTRDTFSGANFKAGPQTLSGSDALSFVRQRDGLPNSDLDRIVRQQAFIAALLRKATSTSVLLNPLELNRLLDAATSSLTTDDALTINDLRKLAGRLKGLDPARVSFQTMPLRTNPSPYVQIDKKDVLVTASIPVLHAFFQRVSLDIQEPPADPAPSAPTGPTQPVTVLPAGVTVRVLNASGADGLATKTSADLAALGFASAGVGSAPVPASDPGTVVRFGPTKSDSARTVAASIPGSRLQADPTLGTTVVVDVGSGYTGVVPVTLGQQVTVPGDTTEPVAPPPPPDPVGPSSAPTQGDQENCVY